MNAHLAAIAAVGWAGLLGVLLLAACWPRERPLRADLPLLLPLGLALGLAVTSVVFFAATLCTTHPGWVSLAVEVMILLGLGWRVARRERFPAADTLPGRPAAPRPDWIALLLATVFVQALVVAAMVAVRAYSKEPYGGWDGWAIWNLQARILFRAGTGWPELLAQSELVWTHPDYPRLIPASVARVWTWMGTDGPFGSAVVSVAFAIATLGILMGALTVRRGRAIGLAAGVLLLTTPFFVIFAPNAHADIPLAAFMLAAVGLAVLHDATPGAGLRWLAGGCAGLAAWTKNEGLLFALLFAGVWAWRHRARAERRRLGDGLAGLALGLVPVVAFKLLLAPDNDLISAPIAPRLAQLWDASRHEMILRALWRDLAGFGEWGVRPYVAMLLPLAFARWRGWQGGERLAAALPAAMLLGYYGVYVLTPHDLRWHLDSSLVRLLMQLWPMALLAWGLALPEIPRLASPNAEGPVPGTRGPWWSAAVVFVNLVLAAIIIGVAARQPAADELARHADRSGEQIVVGLGAGWHGVERAAGERWSWSSGEATLRVHRVGEKRETGSVVVSFDLRSVDERNLFIQAGGRMVWSGAVGDGYTTVQLTGLALPAGTTEFRLTTDRPGVPESPSAGARALAFALYNVTIARN